METWPATGEFESSRCKMTYGVHSPGQSFRYPIEQYPLHPLCTRCSGDCSRKVVVFLMGQNGKGLAGLIDIGLFRIGKHVWLCPDNSNKSEPSFRLFVAH